MGLINKIYNRINYYKQVVLSCFAKYFMKAPKVLSVDETLDLIINDHYSCSRNGDGELNIMMGNSIDFQKKNNRLAAIMREAITAEMDKYVSCLQDVFGDYSQFNDYAVRYYDGFLKKMRYAYYKVASAPVYGNTFITRFYIDYKDKSQAASQIERIKRIWKDQNVILVEGENSRLGVNNDLFSQVHTLRRILCPSENAFDVYDKIKACIVSAATQRNTPPHSNRGFDSIKPTLILLALGPTATALAYELAKMGYWAVDIGHIDIEYEWFLMGATTKVNVPGKYTNECDACKLEGSLPEESLTKYNEEIIAKIF